MKLRSICVLIVLEYMSRCSVVVVPADDPVHGMTHKVNVDWVFQVKLLEI